jgi:hypothetical protein
VMNRGQIWQTYFRQRGGSTPKTHRKWTQRPVNVRAWLGHDSGSHGKYLYDDPRGEVGWLDTPVRGLCVATGARRVL